MDILLLQSSVYFPTCTIFIWVYLSYFASYLSLTFLHKLSHPFPSEFLSKECNFPSLGGYGILQSYFCVCFSLNGIQKHPVHSFVPDARHTWRTLTVTRRGLQGMTHGGQGMTHGGQGVTHGGQERERRMAGKRDQKRHWTLGSISLLISTLSLVFEDIYI